MESFDLECDEESSNWEQVGKIKVCYAENVNITSRHEEVTSVNGRTEPTNLQGLEIVHQTVNYLPKGINKFFPNLKGLVVENSKLKSLKKDDLKSLKQLVYVNFVGNDLESLDGDLFEFNPKLKFIGFGSNKIKYVCGFLLINLSINAGATSSSEILAVLQTLKSQCKWPQDPMLIKENEQLRKEITDFTENGPV